jgi:hypothetical protein
MDRLRVEISSVDLEGWNQGSASLHPSRAAGAQTGVAYFYWGAQTSISGLIGAFTHSSGNIVLTFDRASWGPGDKANPEFTCQRV